MSKSDKDIQAMVKADYGSILGGILGQCFNKQKKEARNQVTKNE